MGRKLESDLVLVLMPFWHTRFPPYALARLTGVARSSGYNTKAFDINLAASNFLSKKFEKNWYADRVYDLTPVLYNKMHFLLQPLLDEYIELIVEQNPKVIGFTLYRSNCKLTYWIAKQLKDRLPQVKIILGGPGVRLENFVAPEVIDHWVIGDGEKALLYILDNFDHKKPMEQAINSISRFNLDDLPMPDYTDFDLDLYCEPETFPAELSRGCTARCTFCESTSFWKYRSRCGNSAIDEVKYISKRYSGNKVAFVDHLLNGNLDELSAFADGIIKKGVDISWFGFARCNKLMDFDYFNSLSKAGCYSLSFGTESGSQKVLDLMNKNITVEEIDQNLCDSHKAGIEVISLWIVGFPGEEQADFAETLATIWRNRKYCNLILGNACVVPSGSKLHTSPEQFGISLGDADTLLNHWQKNDKTNTCLHRTVRSKSINQFFIELKKFGYYEKQKARLQWIDNNYEVKYFSSSVNENVFAEEFNYNIIHTGQGVFVDSLVNECFPFFRTLWRAAGPFEIDFSITPEDCFTFASNKGQYNARSQFKIDSSGVWKLETDHEFIDQISDVKSDDSFSYQGSIEGVW